MTRGAFHEILQAPANGKCMECAASGPQWADLHHGVIICLDCAGVHRSLGVHISFVRSLTMDEWTPDQLRRLQVGGNEKATEFFIDHGVPRGSTGHPASAPDIKARYNHIGAFKYKDKLDCDVADKPWSEENFVTPSGYNPDWENQPVVAANRIVGMGSGPPKGPKTNKKSCCECAIL
ncbi:putative ADP-ribosylation factor GTPase-activating protein AGD6 [Diplonema papillatum]|nr:putative ADP-ribosylation factor GTPase-activating protein AGD6 [Diplonema papillatum]